jgi:4-hydroxy-tetrahydrodipicolinate synthase
MPERGPAPPPPAWLDGLFAVLPTPMAAGGALDLESLDRVVEHYLDGGARGLVPASLAGEGDLLDEAERRQVIERVVRRAAARVPVVVGVLEERTASALAQARAAADCGARALLVKPPFGDAAAVLAHVEAIARALRLPIVLLDHPKYGAPLPVGLVQALVDTVPGVCGIKLEDEPTPGKMARVRAALGPRIRIFGGLGGRHCLRELENGADGFFTGHPQPQHLAAAIAGWRRGDRDAAAAAYAALLPMALRECEDPPSIIGLRKTILRDAGVLRDAAVRPRGAHDAGRTLSCGRAPGRSGHDERSTASGSAGR